MTDWWFTSYQYVNMSDFFLTLFDNLYIIL